MWHHLRNPTFSPFHTIHNDCIYRGNIALCGKNGSCNVTTPLWRTICSPYAGTNYDRPVYWIWNLYVDPLEQGRRKQNECGGPKSDAKCWKHILGPPHFSFGLPQFNCRWEIKYAIHLSDFLYTTQDGIYGFVTAGSWSRKYSIVTLFWKYFIMRQ